MIVYDWIDSDSESMTELYVILHLEKYTHSPYSLDGRRFKMDSQVPDAEQ